MSEMPVLLITMFVLAGLFNVVFPILLGWWIIRKHKTNWKLFGVGVLTFIGSQIFHLPVVNGLTAAFQSGALPHVDPNFAPFFNAIVLGLLAGLFEETARWIGFKLLKKKGDSLGAALTLGAGHGGIEAIIIGGVVLFSLISMLSLRSIGVDSLPLSADQMEATLQQVQAYFATPWHLPLAGAVERIGAVALHITLSIMVWLSYTKRKALWFWGAVLYHAVVDGLTVLAVSFGMGTWILEASFIVVAFCGLYLALKAGKKAEKERNSLESNAIVVIEELPA
ncbi:MAG: hypothetical protein CVU46_08270 [Chloroflexi bacterium HGW-Chloroflexi-8]|nr:MAG: hypothetical protein CVU46_08270 [Chloroflexi bacterium HGW-Chloroflexi-8]